MVDFLGPRKVVARAGVTPIASWLPTEVAGSSLDACRPFQRPRRYSNRRTLTWKPSKRDIACKPTKRRSHSILRPTFSVTPRARSARIPFRLNAGKVLAQFAATLARALVATGDSDRWGHVPVTDRRTALDFAHILKD